MKVDQARLRNEIKEYINWNPVRQTLNIDWDSLCLHILSRYKRMFSPAELERASVPEFKKLEGLVVTDGTFDEIARFIDEMTVYMHQQGLKAGVSRNDGMKARFDQYKEDLDKYKKGKK